MLWNTFSIIPSWLQKLTCSNIYQERNVLLDFGIFDSVQLNRSVVVWNAFCIIPSLLKKLTYSNIYQEMNVLLHICIFFSVLQKISAECILVIPSWLQKLTYNNI